MYQLEVTLADSGGRYWSPYKSLSSTFEECLEKYCNIYKFDQKYGDCDKWHYRIVELDTNAIVWYSGL